MHNIPPLSYQLEFESWSEEQKQIARAVVKMELDASEKRAYDEGYDDGKANAKRRR